MVTSEATPFVKTGGLADVLGALPPALVSIGEEVCVVIPRYGSTSLHGEDRIIHEMPLTVGPHTFTAAIDEVQREGVRYLFVDCPSLYGRSGVYNERGVDYADNHIRFAALNQAALEIARSIFTPDIFHAHDWPAGLLAPYLRETRAADSSLQSAKCVMTIHNLGYQGLFPRSHLGDIGLSPLFHPEGLEFWGQINYLKAGIVWSDAVTTVSPTYAHEMQTLEYGFGLDGVLRARASRITGILNGVDYAEWDPEHDPHVRHHYSARNLSGKRFAKQALLKELGLPLSLKRPLIGMVSRFADQKGFDLVAEIADQLAAEDLALVILGTGEARIEDALRRIAATHPERFAVHVGYDEVLAHRIEAGADMFLMPSRYEPCGLNQIYSLRYGTVPIVRSTGGLEDTVDDSTGFKFHDYSAEALLYAVRRALTAWKDRKLWRERMRRGMARDFSWTASAVEYQQLYDSIRLHSEPVLHFIPAGSDEAPSVA